MEKIKKNQIEKMESENPDLLFGNKVTTDLDKSLETPADIIEDGSIFLKGNTESDTEILNNDQKFSKENFYYILEEYRDLQSEYTSYIDDIVSDEKTDLNEKMQKLVDIGCQIEFESTFKISKLDKITERIEMIRNEALNCLIEYDDKGMSHLGNYYFNGENDLQWLINNCIVDKRQFIYYLQYKHFYELTSRQLIASKYYLQISMFNLKGQKKIKISKKTRITSYSLSETTYLFALLRDENVISATNINISDAISLVTGFSNKQAVNQFSINSNKENIGKLKAQTKALLEKLLKRLE